MNLPYDEKAKLTIGLLVYNGEELVKERIEQIRAQTFQDFILIISDNGSNDKTQEICEKISKTDKKIIYFRHEENRGPYWNFNFLVKKAKTKYFVWAAVDDIWSHNFLEKNIEVLENNEEIVGSIGEMKMFNRIKDPLTNKTEIIIIENSKKFQYVHPINGDVGKKIRFYLNYNMGGIIYGIYRTDKIQKANTFEHYKNNRMWRWALACILNVIKEGDLEVINDVFIYKEVNVRSTSTIQYMRRTGFSSMEILFINFPFTIWFIKNLGIKEFLRNFGYFTTLNITSEFGIISELLRMCKRIAYGQDRYW